MIAGGNPEGAELDQPMTRRERRERERAAEAAAQARSDGTPDGEGGSAAQRPVIRPASRAPERADSGPAPHSDAAWHAGSPHTAPMPTAETQAYPAANAAGGWSTSQGQASLRGPAAAQSAFAASAADRGQYGGPAAAGDHSGGGAERSAAGTSAAGSGRTSRKRKTEYQPLGPVRGTIRAFGELCITAGMVLILFVVWQLWWTDIAANRDNEVLADKLITDWQENPANELPDDPDTPYVADPVEENTGFGIMYVPRFGEGYYRTVAEGVSMEPVLNRMGVGRYPSSAMPGEVGNFSVAGHRVTYGKPLNQIHELRPGDEIVVQTADGFYTYTFRNFEIVLPDATEVLAAVPTMPDYKGKDRIMTLTACNPMFSARERYVAYAELTDWTPAGDGAPASIADSPAYEKVGGDA